MDDEYRARPLFKNGFTGMKVSISAKKNDGPEMRGMIYVNKNKAGVIEFCHTKTCGYDN